MPGRSSKAKKRKGKKGKAKSAPKRNAGKGKRKVKVGLNWDKKSAARKRTPGFSPWMLSRKPRKNPKKKGKWVCYCLKTKNPAHSRKTYVGKTNDLFRRLDQHNGKLVGGAKYTSGRGPWKPFLVIKGFKYEHECLQFEWAMHNPIEKDPITRKNRVIRRHGARGRCKSLELILSKKRWTSSAPLLKNYNLQIHTRLSKEMYCDWAGITEAEFDARRAKRPNIQFIFDVTKNKIKSSI